MNIDGEMRLVLGPFRFVSATAGELRALLEGVPDNRRVEISNVSGLAVRSPEGEDESECGDEDEDPAGE